MVMKDPLVGALPEQTNMASQPLTGLPSSMTGGVGTGMIPPQSGQPGLAPAPSPNSTQVGGAPLSGNDADTRQAGAGADFDLVKDRGKPDEFHANNLLEAGSEKATQLATDIAGGNRTGDGMNQEDINREGTRANVAMGMDTQAKADAVVTQVVLDPLAKTIKAEIASDDIDPETGLTRQSQTQLQVSGAESSKDVETQVDAAAKRTGIKDKGVIKRTKEAMVKWWKLGKDNPNTEEREDQTVQVTNFMGGMNRQELGMFVFQWGAMLMANSSEGFGAMGTASLGAMQGHQGRKATEAASALSAEEMDIKRRNATSSEETAAAATTRAEAYAEGMGAVRGGVGEWKREFYRSIGWSDEKIAQAAEGILTTEQLFDDVSAGLRDQRAEAAAKETMNMPDNMRRKTAMPDGTKVPTADLTDQQINDLATASTQSSIKARGALGGAKPGSSALNKSTSDYLNEAQTNDE
jgi:hypothetical protein